MEIHSSMKHNQIEIEFCKFNSHLQKKIFLCSFDIQNHQLPLLQHFIYQLQNNQDAIYEEDGMILHYIHSYRLFIIHYKIDHSTYSVHFENLHLKNQLISILRNFIQKYV